MGADLKGVSQLSKTVNQKSLLIDFVREEANSQAVIEGVFNQVQCIKVPSSFDINWDTNPQKLTGTGWPECVGSCVKCILSLQHLNPDNRIRSLLVCLHLLPFCLDKKFGVNRQVGSCVALFSLKVFGTTIQQIPEEAEQKLQNFIIKVGCHQTPSSVSLLYGKIQEILIDIIAKIEINASLLNPIIEQFRHIQIKLINDKKNTQAQRSKIQVKALTKIIQNTISSLIYLYESEEMARMFLSYQQKLQFNSQLVCVILREIVKHLNDEASKNMAKSPVSLLLEKQKYYKKTQNVIEEVLNDKQMSKYML